MKDAVGTVSGSFDKADAEFWSVIEGLDIVVPVGAS